MEPRSLILVALCVATAESLPASPEPPQALGDTLKSRSDDAFTAYANDFTQEYEPVAYAAIPLHHPMPVIAILSDNPLTAAPPKLFNQQPLPSAKQPAYAKPEYQNYVPTEYKPEPEQKPYEQYSLEYQKPYPTEYQKPYPTEYQKPYPTEYQKPYPTEYQKPYPTEYQKPYALEYQKPYEYPQYPPLEYAKPYNTIEYAKNYPPLEYPKSYNSYNTIDYPKSYLPIEYPKPYHVDYKPYPSEYTKHYSSEDYRPYASEHVKHYASDYVKPHASVEAPTILYARPTKDGGYTYHRRPLRNRNAKRPRKTKPVIIRVHKYRTIRSRSGH